MAVSKGVSNVRRGSSRTTSAGRRQTLIYIDPLVLKDLKKLAIDLEVSASVVIERAAREFLERHRKMSR